MGRQLKEGVGAVWVRNEDGSDMVSFAEGVDIPKWAAEQMGDHLFEKHSAKADSDPDEFDPDTATKAELEAEIDRRNEGRDDDQKISKSGNKDDLLAALEADSE